MTSTDPAERALLRTVLNRAIEDIDEFENHRSKWLTAAIERGVQNGIAKAFPAKS